MTKTSILLLALCGALCSCSNTKDKEATSPPAIIGTWRMVSAMTIKGSDTTIVNHAQNLEFMKIISPTHFAFLQHDRNHGKDSTASFVAGGGTVKFGEGKYTETLEYCNYREWEGGVFELNYVIMGDTLVTTAHEKVEKLNVDQINIETLVRVK